MDCIWILLDNNTNIKFWKTKDSLLLDKIIEAM